jgi:hypothetical protein
MRVAALYDVHGNLPALDAVLAEVPDDAAIVIGGDVAAGPFPSATLSRLRGLGDRVHWLRGNADRVLAPGEEPGAYWALLGPALGQRRTAFEPAPNDFPSSGPPLSRAEATAFLEAHAVGA